MIRFLPVTSLLTGKTQQYHFPLTTTNIDIVFGKGHMVMTWYKHNLYNIYGIHIIFNITRNKDGEHRDILPFFHNQRRKWTIKRLEHWNRLFFACKTKCPHHIHTNGKKDKVQLT